MVKRVIGWILFLTSYPLMFVGGALFVVNLLRPADFITPIVMVGVGYIFRLIGQRLQRIPY